MSWRAAVVQATCERCGDVRWALGPFIGEHGGDCRVHEAGEWLDETDPLERGRVHRARVERYCARCFREYRCAEVATEYGCVLRWIREGALEVPQMTPRAIETWGSQAVRRLEHAKHPVACEPLPFSSIVWHGVPGICADATWVRFWEDLEKRINANLAAAGWARWLRWFRTFPVTVDPSGRMRIETVRPRAWTGAAESDR